MDLTLGAIVGKIAEGLPVAVGLFLLLIAGQKGMWLWKRENDALNAMWQSRFEEAERSWEARFDDMKSSCNEWKDVAMRTIGAAEKIVPAVTKSTESKQ